MSRILRAAALIGLALLPLVVLPAAPRAQTSGGCQSKCGFFGDQYSCSSCLGMEPMRKELKRKPPPTARRQPGGIGQEEWEEQRRQEELMDSERHYRDFCIGTDLC